MHIYALNGAAALAGVENSAVNDIRGCVRQIRIRADVGWVITTEFQVQWQDSTGSCLTKTEASLRRSDKGNQLDLGNLDDLVENLPSTEVDNL